MRPENASRRAFCPIRTRRAGALVAGVLSVTIGMSGCAVTNAINAAHAVVDAARNLKGLESEIQKGEKVSYEASYKSTGGSSTPATVTFAQAPGGKYAYMTPSSGSTGGTDFVANGKDEYTCSQSGSGASWSCTESPESSTSSIDADPFYAMTGAYYYSIIEGLSVVAAVAGFKVTNSTTTVNGISLRCVAVKGKSNGQTEDDEWCVTSDGILGLVKDTSSESSDNSAFTITRLTRNPPASVFNPPKGASVTSQASS